MSTEEKLKQIEKDLKILNELKSMPIHSTRSEHTSTTTVLRVPGGWIYSILVTHGDRQLIFVPIN